MRRHRGWRVTSQELRLSLGRTRSPHAGGADADPASVHAVPGWEDLDRGLGETGRGLAGVCQRQMHGVNAVDALIGLVIRGE